MSTQPAAAADPLVTARRLADDLLFPAALEVDAADRVPRSHLDALAAAGFYGLSAPVEVGGLGADPDTRGRVVEELAGGCLATAFVWLQHEGVARRSAGWAPALRDRWARRLCRGEVRAGIAVSAVRPGAEGLRAVRRGGGAWLLTGTAAWVTGWGLIDVVHVAALDPEGDVVWFLVDAGAGRTLRTERTRLVAVDASSTVTVTFEDHQVPADRCTGRTPYADWQGADAAGLRGNGSLPLGLAGRCARLLGPSPHGAALAAEVDDARDRLDAAAGDARAGADSDALALARAAAAELAWRAAGAVVAAHGARSVARTDHAQRIAREAMFLLVFGSRAPVKTELLRLLTHVADPPGG